LSPHEQEVAEFIIYAVEGLYWTGTYCDDACLVERAKVTFDALVRTDKVWPGNTYFQYHTDWRPVEAHVRAGPADIERDMLSSCGQYARLAHHFWKRTGGDLYRREFLATLEAMYDAQDQTSDSPKLLGGWPRATNHPWGRSVCPAYNYVGAVLLDRDLLARSVLERERHVRRSRGRSSFLRPRTPGAAPGPAPLPTTSISSSWKAAATIDASSE
jgi:hypothetical protein